MQEQAVWAGGSLARLGQKDPEKGQQACTSWAILDTASQGGPCPLGSRERSLLEQSCSHADPSCGKEPPQHPLPFAVNMWHRLLRRMSELSLELSEVQLFRLQVPGGTTRGRGRREACGQESRNPGRQVGGTLRPGGGAWSARDSDSTSHWTPPREGAQQVLCLRVSSVLGSQGAPATTVS